MKKILDSVHGHILVDDCYITAIIDTPEFQRLRRVEQTSIRSVYPSARHDRFIHSLGVFYVGKMIAEHLEKECCEFGIDVKTYDILKKSYLSACLLHDVGHAPFSHTFEEFYGKKKKLSERLANSVNSDEFTSDIEGYFDDANFHELVSAYLAVERFSHTLQPIDVNMEFVARMITGCFYESKPKNQIRNCFISLLHGEVIDADRLDYGCRDVWASGYSTSNIDLRRLISALHIKKNENEEFVVCFDCNVINEIDNLLSVKDFQMKYVINHHTVAYDQWLLVQAVQSLSKKLFMKDVEETHPEDKPEDKEFLCMNRICSVDSLVKKVPVGDYHLFRPSDDDFVFMLKQDEDNPYFSEWYSRQYTRFALWKSPDEFSHYFGIIRGTDLKNDEFKVVVKKNILKKYNIDDVVIKKIKFKPHIKLSSLYILVHGDLRRFTEIYPNDKEQKQKEITFYYVYVKKQSNDHEEIENLRSNIIKDLRGPIQALYFQSEKDDKGTGYNWYLHLPLFHSVSAVVGWFRSLHT